MTLEEVENRVADEEIDPLLLQFIEECVVELVVRSLKQNPRMEVD